MKKAKTKDNLKDKKVAVHLKTIMGFPPVKGCSKQMSMFKPSNIDLQFLNEFLFSQFVHLLS